MYFYFNERKKDKGSYLSKIEFKESGSGYILQ